VKGREPTHIAVFVANARTQSCVIYDLVRNHLLYHRSNGHELLHVLEGGHLVQLESKVSDTNAMQCTKKARGRRNVFVYVFACWCACVHACVCVSMCVRKCWGGGQSALDHLTKSSHCFCRCNLWKDSSPPGLVMSRTRSTA
jgi:hypothetical protein